MLWIMLTVSVTPGVVLLSYFYLKDIYEAEPLRSVFWCFLLGMMAVFPVISLQQWVSPYLQSLYLHVLFVASGIEELFKFLILLSFMRRSREVNEVYDGILYSAAIALGFATVENIFAVLPQGLETAAVRAFLPVPGHALFGVVMGYYAGNAKFGTGGLKKRKAAKALLYAWGLHAIYDLILTGNQYFWSMLIIPFMVMLWVLGLKKIKSAQQRSPFKPKE